MLKGRRPPRRRRASRGFTLLELMVVVMLVAILAVIATPTMATARADRLAFDYARQTSELFHNARARSAGRGAAHLALFTTESSVGARGAVLVFEGLDGTAPPTGPNPSASCRANGQWAFAASFAPGGATADARARLIDGLNIETTEARAVQVVEDITMRGFTNVGGTRTAVTTFAMCTTPNGTTYVGTGANASGAISAMAASTPFTGIVEVGVERHRGGTSIGLKRRVILAGAGAPRIKSE